MSDRRAARARKKVDYTKFGGSDDFDDDFADSTPPPSKKPKISSDKDLKKKVTANQEKKKSTKRAPLVEKVYERELQAALELSFIESQSSNCDDDEDFKPQNNKKSSVIKIDKDKLNNTELTCSDTITEVKNVLCTVEVNEENKTNVINKERQIIKSVDCNTEDTGNTIQNLHNIQENKLLKTDGNYSDGIVVLDKEDNIGRGGRRRLIPKAKVIDDSEDDDSEFGLDEDEADDTDEDEDYDDENDSDFDCGSKNKKKASNMKSSASNMKSSTSNMKSSTPKQKKQIKTKATIKTAASTKGPLSVTGRHVDKSPAVTVKPMGNSLASKPVVTSPIIRTVQKWNPPGSAGNVKSPLVGTSIKSPSSGLSIKSPGMRVGLSRNQRVRSLHPGLTLKTT